MKKKADPELKSVAKGSRAKKSSPKNKQNICLCSLARRVSRFFTNYYNRAFSGGVASSKGGKYETADISVAQDGTIVEKPRDDKRRSNINISQFTLLEAIKRKNEEGKDFSQKDLAEELNIDNTTLCRNLRVLMVNGWVCKTRKDVSVKLTQCGNRTLTEAEKSWQDAQDAVKKKLREHNLKPEEFTELMQIVCEAF